MKILACNFALLLRQTNLKEGAHHYPISYIESHVLQTGTAHDKQFPSESTEEKQKHRDDQDAKKRAAIGTDPNRRVCDPDPENARKTVSSSPDVN
jgi:hypothetical protein